LFGERRLSADVIVSDVSEGVVDAIGIPEAYKMIGVGDDVVVDIPMGRGSHRAGAVRDGVSGVLIRCKAANGPRWHSRRVAVVLLTKKGSLLTSKYSRIHSSPTAAVHDVAMYPPPGSDLTGSHINNAKTC
jgi:hypothetical protein